MFFTAVSRNARNRKQVASNSKSSQHSLNHNIQKKRIKMPEISKAEQQLRNAIENKYTKSKLKEFRYENQWDTCSFASEKSDEMEKYSWLKNHRFINLKEYHQNNVSRSEIIQKKYLIRIKNSENRKNTRTENDTEFSPNNYSNYSQLYKKEKTQKITKLVDSFALNEKRTLSDDKKTKDWQHMGFDWRSGSKKVKNNFVSPSDRKQQNHGFRKIEKQGQRVIRSQNQKF